MCNEFFCNQVQRPHQEFCHWQGCAKAFSAAVQCAVAAEVVVTVSDKYGGRNRNGALSFDQQDFFYRF